MYVNVAMRQAKRKKHVVPKDEVKSLKVKKDLLKSLAITKKKELQTKVQEILDLMKHQIRVNSDHSLSIQSQQNIRSQCLLTN